MSTILARARQIILDEILPNLHTDSSHSIEHFDKVAEHCTKAVEDSDLSDEKKEWIIIAGECHDLDDEKLTGKSKGYPNATLVLVKLGIIDSEYEGIHPIITMIDLVSCSKNGDSFDDTLPLWYYIPRYADRLEGTGQIGIERTITYNTRLGRSMHSVLTERVSSREELELVATKERYELYTSGVVDKYPLTVLDHIYDKIYHLSIPEWFSNTYIESQMSSKKEYVIKWVVEYWSERQ